MKATKVSIAFETTYGEAPAGGNLKPYVLCIDKNGLQAEDSTEEVKCIGGEFDSGGDLFITGTDVKGDISQKIYYEQIGVMLKMVMGTPVSVDNGDGTFLHTYTTTKSCAESATIQNLSDNSAGCDPIALEFVQQSYGVRGLSYNHKFTGKGVPEVSVGLSASTYKDSIKDTITKFDEANQVMLPSTKANAKKASVSVAGADYCKFAEFDISLEKEIDEQDLICDGGRKDSYSMGVSVNGSLNGVFDATMYEKIAKNQVVPIVVKYEDGNNFLKYFIDETQFQFKSSPAEAGTRLMIDSAWVAKRSSTGNQKLKVELKNSIASY